MQASGPTVLRSRSVALDQQLLDILACPDTHHAPLDYDAAAQTLTCTECRRVFEVRDDIPVLLLDEARVPGSRTDEAPAVDGEAG
jgi:uncharacterized protein YbaR (Trm112 family)